MRHRLGHSSESSSPEKNNPHRVERIAVMRGQESADTQPLAELSSHSTRSAAISTMPVRRLYSSRRMESLCGKQLVEHAVAVLEVTRQLACGDLIARVLEVDRQVDGHRRRRRGKRDDPSRE